ncbi:MAG: MASE1 domain-containing protein [Candidatus Binatia bacterium]
MNQNTTPPLRTLASVLSVAVLYFCAGKLGLSLAFLHASASAVWPPSGIALAILLLWGYRAWPGIFLGAFLVNITTQGSLATTLGIAAANSLEALSGAWLVNRFANGLRAFEQAPNIFKFALAAALSTVVSATFGVTSLTLGGFARWEQYPVIWLTWWLGDTVGDLLVAPLVVVWVTQPYPRFKTIRVVEAAGLLFALILVGRIVFLGGIPSGMEYTAILPLLWATFRFGQRGGVTSAFVISGLALVGTLKGLGPFATINPNESLLLLQAFVGTLSMAALVLAAVISERKRAEERLHVQDSVSRILAESPALKEAAPKIVRVLCEKAGWEIGAIWNVNKAANELACVEVWHIPGTHVPEFESVTRQIRFAPGIGLPGRVWSSAKPAWIPDVTQDNNFPRAPIATKECLHAAFGFPIKLGSEVVGVIECFSQEVREPDDHFLQIAADIGSQLGQFRERKRGEDLLRAKERQLNTITNITPVLLTQCSRELRYKFVNRAYAEMLGLRPEQVIGNFIEEIMGREAFRTIHPYVETVLQGQPVAYEAHIPFERIGARFLRVAYTPDRDEHGDVSGWIASITDISEQKAAEAALRQAQEELAKANEELETRVLERTADLQQAQAALVREIEEEKKLEEQLRQSQKMESLGTLAGGIAHEFNNILNIISGSAQLIRRRSSRAQSVAEDLEVIDQTIKRAASMVRELLTLARKTQAHLNSADANHVILDLTKLLKQTFPKDIELSLALDPQLPSVVADPNQISQALLNLCLNARDAMAIGGQLTISTKSVDGSTVQKRHTGATATQYIAIEVSDTGVGMDQSIYKRIFEPFFTTKGIGEGTGLGLAIVYGIMTNHSGFIEVDSEAGRGATFRLYLPLVPPENQPSPMR